MSSLDEFDLKVDLAAIGLDGEKDEERHLVHMQLSVSVIRANAFPRSPASLHFVILCGSSLAHQEFLQTQQQHAALTWRRRRQRHCLLRHLPAICGANSPYATSCAAQKTCGMHAWILDPLCSDAPFLLTALCKAQAA